VKLQVTNDRDTFTRLLQDTFTIEEVDTTNENGKKLITIEIKNAKKDIEITSDEQKTDEKDRTIQVLNIYLFYKQKEIHSAFKHVGEIEKIHTEARNGMYQHAFITFKDKNSILPYFSDKWYDYIANNIVQIIPLSLSTQQRELRRQFGLKLSGLPIGTSGRDIEQYVTRLKGKSIFIPRNPVNYTSGRYAYVYFDNQESLDNALNLTNTFIEKGKFKQQLFWSKSDSKICNFCGNPNHIIKDCNEKAKAATRKLSAAKVWANKNREIRKHVDSKKMTYAEKLKTGINKPNNYAIVLIEIQNSMNNIEYIVKIILMSDKK
jgi:RNA recognition motif-containing protein